MSDKNQEDKAGDLLGWSLNTGMEKKNFDELVDFPSDFTFKIIGTSSADFKTEVVEAIETYRSKEVEVIGAEIKKSRKENYLSLTLVLRVQSSQDIYDVYEACQKMPQIKFVL